MKNGNNYRARQNDRNEYDGDEWGNSRGYESRRKDKGNERCREARRGNRAQEMSSLSDRD